MKDQLEKMLGKDRVVVDPDALSEYDADISTISPRPPEAAVRPATTEQVVQPETPESTRQGESPAAIPKDDEDLLSKLTEPSQPAETKAVTKNEEIRKKPVESQEQVQKKILDQLTRHGEGPAVAPIKDENITREQTDKSEAGESGDA